MNSSCHAAGDGIQGHVASPGAPMTAAYPLVLRGFWSEARVKEDYGMFSLGLCQKASQSRHVGSAAPRLRPLVIGILVLRTGWKR